MSLSYLGPDQHFRVRSDYETIGNLETDDLTVPRHTKKMSLNGALQGKCVDLVGTISIEHYRQTRILDLLFDTEQILCTH